MPLTLILWLQGGLMQALDHSAYDLWLVMQMMIQVTLLLVILGWAFLWEPSDPESPVPEAETPDWSWPSAFP